MIRTGVSNKVAARIGGLPDLPRSTPFVPQTVQLIAVTKRVHAVPESGMAIGVQLAISGRGFQRFPLQHSVIAGNQVQETWRHYEKTAVYPILAELGLFHETGYFSACSHLEFSVARGGVNGGHRRESAVLVVEVSQCAQVNVRNAIAIGQHECFISQVRLKPLDATSSHGVVPGIDQCNLPVDGLAFMILHVSIREVNAEICIAGMVMQEVVLDHVALVSQGDYEILEALGGIKMKDVPDDGLAPDFNQGFGDFLRKFREPGAITTGKNDDFHDALLRHALEIILINMYSSKESRFIH